MLPRRSKIFWFQRMWEKEILEGIEKVLDQKGKFNPELDSSTIRSQERLFAGYIYRIKIHLISKKYIKSNHLLGQTFSKHFLRILKALQRYETYHMFHLYFETLKWGNYTGTLKLNKNGKKISNTKYDSFSNIYIKCLLSIQNWVELRRTFSKNKFWTFGWDTVEDFSAIASNTTPQAKIWTEFSINSIIINLNRKCSKFDNNY